MSLNEYEAIGMDQKEFHQMLEEGINCSDEILYDVKECFEEIIDHLRMCKYPGALSNERNTLEAE